MIFLYLSITLISYIIAKKMYKLYPHPFLTPVLTGTCFVLVVIYSLNLSMADYAIVELIAGELLGPATVALAIPVYKHRSLIAAHVKEMACGIFAGVSAALFFSLISISLYNFTTGIATALLVKTTTVPIALELTAMQGGDVSLTVLTVMSTGVIGAVFGPKILSFFNIYHAVARGTAIGSIAHGIGTAHIVQEGELEGASSAVAMAAAGVSLSILLGIMH
ncbi:LrgB family protein [Alkalicoccus daliensis]|uniref:Putative effector of murein hydrolase n=1 Tax=Alkalicoccus daliensis TaxID=745820 RepID=A0A1G9ZNY3_9BACI|nr:LrgB family protein [Alkalicoccus daliensis]SDN22817.1 Putative effector of murein hydrolase [Alkalicoccus daliensis]